MNIGVLKEKKGLPLTRPTQQAFKSMPEGKRGFICRFITPCLGFIIGVAALGNIVLGHREMVTDTERSGGRRRREGSGNLSPANSLLNFKDRQRGDISLNNSTVLLKRGKLAGKASPDSLKGETPPIKEIDNWSGGNVTNGRQKRGRTVDALTANSQEGQKHPIAERDMAYRSGSNSERPKTRLPNILLIGAQKGGSTAISNWLFDHDVCRPKVFPGEPQWYNKEVQFFDQNKRYEQGLNFYADRFRHCKDTAWMMDATPNYLIFPERVHRTYAEAGVDQVDSLKILVILREPISRELSLYNHRAKLFWEENMQQLNFWKTVTDVDGDRAALMSFGEFTRRKLLRHMNATAGLCANMKMIYSCYSLYADHLQKWMELFNPENILVLAYEELIKNENNVMSRVRSFLGLAHNLGPAEIEAANAQWHDSKVSLPPCSVQTQLARNYRKANENLYALLESNPRPSMEQKPFPRFVLSNCTQG